MNSTVFNVPALDATPIKPADEWKHKTTFGFMGFNDTPAGRLVRLADVLKWGMNNPVQRPYSAALKDFCSAIPNDAMEWLYQVNMDYAKSIDSKNNFGFHPPIPEDQLKANIQNNQRGKIFHHITTASGRHFKPAASARTDNSKACLPGVPSLVRTIGESWSRESSPDGRMMCDSEKLPINFLAIPFEKAHQHWGWGVLQEAPKSGPDDGIDPTPSDLRKRSQGNKWTTEQHALLLMDFSSAKGRLQSEKRKYVGKLWRIGPDAVKTQLTKANAQQKKAQKAALMHPSLVAKK